MTKPWLALLLVFFCSGMSFAGDNEPKGYLIESIVFSGLVYGSESLLKATLPLVEGKVYTEADLAHAKYRLEQLRFVLDAQVSLQRGSKAPAYQLLITVVETKRYFWALFGDLAFIRDDFYEAESSPASQDLISSSTTPRANGLAIGRRWFLGSYGELNLFLPFRPGISYTHYNLFHRNVISSLAVQIPTGYGKNFSDFPEQERLTQVSTRDSWGMTFSMGTPYRRYHWFNLTYQLNWGKLTAVEPIADEPLFHKNTTFRNHRTEFSWSYDTKDHPLFPTSGLYVKAATLLDREYRDVKERDFRLVLDPDNQPYGQSHVPYDNLGLNSFEAYATAKKLWRQPKDMTLGLTAGLRLGYHDIHLVNADDGYKAAPDYNSRQFLLKGLFAWNLLEQEFWGKNRDFRLELEAEHHWLSSNLEEFFPDPDLDRSALRLGLTYRDNFGLLRFSLLYTTTNEELWQ